MNHSPHQKLIPNMAKIKCINSVRDFEHRAFFQIVYEWEDEVGRTLGVPIKRLSNRYVTKLGTILNRLIGQSGLSSFFHGYSVEFNMFGGVYDKKHVRPNTIPWVIDFFKPEDEVKKYISSLPHVPLALISSREVYEKLKAMGVRNIEHLALSLPDIWMPKSADYWNEKDFDLILIGRISERFLEYINRYKYRHPNFRMAKCIVENGAFNIYAMDESHKFVGNADTRSDYMRLLQRSKAFLYSTPGIDNDRNTYGFSPVTPKFLEALSCGCNLVMRYADNADTRWYNLQSFGPSVNTYENFEMQLDDAISIPPDFHNVVSYLKRHTTSARALRLESIVANL